MPLLQFCAALDTDRRRVVYLRQSVVPATGLSLERIPPSRVRTLGGVLLRCRWASRGFRPKVAGAYPHPGIGINL